MKGIVILEHEADIHRGLLADLLPEARVLHLWREEDRATLASMVTDRDLPSGLVVLGGRANAYADEQWPTLPLERALIRECVSEDRPLLGICLGLQLLAVATGGRVEVGAPAGPEYGITPIEWSEEAAHDELGHRLLGVRTVFEDHSDAVTELPPGAVLLASSARYPQVVRVGSAVGVQFHPEVTRELARAWQEENTVTDTDEVLAGFDAHGEELAATCRILASWLIEAASRED